MYKVPLYVIPVLLFFPIFQFFWNKISAKLKHVKRKVRLWHTGWRTFPDTILSFSLIFCKKTLIILKTTSERIRNADGSA